MAGGSGVGGAGELGGWPGGVGGQGSSAIDASARATGMLQGAGIGLSGVFPRGPDGRFPSAGPGGSFLGAIGGINIAALPGLSGELDGTTSETPFSGSGGAQKGIRGS